MGKKKRLERGSVRDIRKRHKHIDILLPLLALSALIYLVIIVVR